MESLGGDFLGCPAALVDVVGRSLKSAQGRFFGAAGAITFPAFPLVRSWRWWGRSKPSRDITALSWRRAAHLPLALSSHRVSALNFLRLGELN